MRVSLFFFFLFGSLFSQQEETAITDPLAQILDAPAEVAAAPAPAPAHKETPPPAPPKPPASPTEGYTINYNTVSIIEYIKFASKICKVNFIYEEADLNFTVTVVSDEPVTPANVMATLIQVLRVHGCMLLEQDNNLVIHKSKDVKQVANLVTGSSQEGTSPIVTRIFRLRNANPGSIAAVIQPMISTTALLEVSAETKQLILTDITANVDKIAALIENLDSPHTTLEIKSFSAQHNKPDFLIELASQIMNPIAQGNPFILVPQNLANEVFIVSTPELVAKAMEVFTSLDTVPKMELAPKKSKPETVFVYKVMNRSGEDVLKGLTNIAQNLQSTAAADPDLVQTIDQAKWIKETNSILFIGTSDALDKVRQFLSALDVTGGGSPFGEKTSFFVYKPVYRSAEEIQKAILEMATNLKGTSGATPSLIDTIHSVKINPTTHTLTFSGEEKNFSRIQELLSTIDSSSGKLTAIPPPSQFLIYKPVNQSGEQLSSELKEVAAQLKADKLADPGLLNALGTMKWVKATHSLMFTGDPASLQKIQSMISNFDVIASKGQNFIQYHPKYASQEKTESYLKQVAQNLTKKGGSDSLVETLQSYKWIPDSQTFMFTGSDADLSQVKDILTSFDTPGAGPSAKPGYYIYKVQHTTGDVIEEDLDNLSKNFKSSGLKDVKILDVISKMRYVKQTNSLLLTGDPEAIEEVKTLIAQYDYPRAATGPVSSNFYMYKPQNLPAGQIEKSLKDVGANLKSAGLADPNLLKAIDSSKYVDTTNSLVFTGTPDALDKIQSLIKDIDLPPKTHAPIQHVGKTTFLLYKLKNASGPNIVASLRNMAAELKRTNTSDKDLLAALNTIKYVKETNSLFFSGTEEALNKVQGLVEQFDVTSLAPKPEISAPTGPSNFFVYKPLSLAGPDLEKLLQDFGDHLKSSGLSDPELFSAINSMRWTERTQTLVFTGTPKALDQVKELLKQFDTPSNLPQGPDLSTAGEPTIQAIDNTSFLVYKLQFHKGDEIQGALKQIAKDLIISNAPVNQNLLNSINSIQWLEVTNSLLSSGDQETLTRLRELIKNLDIPLKQVFIEMLVMETTLANVLTLGLEWGGNYKYRDKFGAATYNSQPISQGGGPDAFLTNLQGLVPPVAPSPTKIPVSSGFDLGIIGEVIRFKGGTYLTLGSILNALQTDSDTNIIMTPKLIAQDGRTSSLFDGSNIPFVGSFVQNNGSNVVNTSNLEYRDIGFNLTVTPVLGNSDIVTLDISLDSSSVIGAPTGAINFAASSAQGITTKKTTMSTTVHVPDNSFLILSGMVNNSDVKIKNAIPCLGGLPIVGAFFTQNSDNVTHDNIVIFIRPRIINSAEDLRRITAQEEEFFRDQAGSPYLEQRFDEGMELIKTADDE